MLALRQGTKRKLEDGVENDDDDDDEEVVAEDNSDETLLQLYKHHSGRKCHQLRPKVWNTHGKWTRLYKHLEGRVEKQTSGAGGSHGRVTNRPWVTHFALNGTTVQAGFVIQQADNYSRIVIAFTRASSLAPTYGLPGMFTRAAVAAKAWCRLEPDSKALIIALPRSRTASKEPLEGTKALTSEMKLVLNAAADGMVVELLSVGIDGLTTHLPSLVWLQSNWGQRLRLRLIVVVAAEFPGTSTCFPTMPNTIRYGKFELTDICRVLDNPDVPGYANSKELVRCIQEIRELKLDRDDGYTTLNRLTSGRANFRVCPDSTTDSGVD